ncbi:MAG: hypothetical protein KC586_11075 [Myxococcales bacterium]|nr:hypothetical protein [Myxococcales bacterium]
MKKLALVGILSVLGFGCGDDDGGRTSDSGLTLMDSGTIMLPDTGTMPMVDSGTTPMGECADPVPSLEELAMDPSAPAGLLPRCSLDTAMCLNDAADAAGQEACIAADTTTPLDVEGNSLDCEFCWNYQFEACLSGECRSQYAAFSCCYEAAGCSGSECPACETELNALISCFQGGADCNSYLIACFPEG